MIKKQTKFKDRNPLNVINLWLTINLELIYGACIDWICLNVNLKYLFRFFSEFSDCGVLSYEFQNNKTEPVFFFIQGNNFGKMWLQLTPFDQCFQVVTWSNCGKLSSWLWTCLHYQKWYLTNREIVCVSVRMFCVESFS